MSIGDFGEELVVKKLKQAGFEILNQNWRSKIGEVDIIAKKSNFLHFVEVKTLQIPNLDDLKPEDHFTKSKFQKLKKLAEYYCLFYGIALEYEIDLAAVSVFKDKITLKLYHNVSS